MRARPCFRGTDRRRRGGWSRCGASTAWAAAIRRGGAERRRASPHLRLGPAKRKNRRSPRGSGRFGGGRAAAPSVGRSTVPRAARYVSPVSPGHRSGGPGRFDDARPIRRLLIVLAALALSVDADAADAEDPSAGRHVDLGEHPVNTRDRVGRLRAGRVQAHLPSRRLDEARGLPPGGPINLRNCLSGRDLRSHPGARPTFRLPFRRRWLYALRTGASSSGRSFA